MGRPVRIAWRVAIALVVICGGACNRAPELEERRELLTAPTQAQVVQAHHENTRVFDDQGALKPSDELVSGLRLPRGLKLQTKLPRRWVYDTTVPHERLREYFAPRLDTGAATPGGGALTFKHARSKESEGAIFFDVVIGAKPGVPGHNFVDIREHAPVPVKWPTDQEVRKAIAEAARRAE